MHSYLYENDLKYYCVLLPNNKIIILILSTIGNFLHIHFKIFSTSEYLNIHKKNWINLCLMVTVLQLFQDLQLQRSHVLFLR